MNKKISNYIITTLALIWGFSGVLTLNINSVNSANFNNILLKTSISSDEKEESDELDFIKSGNNIKSFLDNDKLFLYGGIALCSISVGGITFILMPKRQKKNKKRKDQQ
ncbi:MAG: hypothetical protein Q4B84_03035 [Clostridia bacterium]|nr:hypothetical protein [Clostridia bacterium]